MSCFRTPFSFVFISCQFFIFNMLVMMLIFCCCCGNICFLYICTVFSDQWWSLQITHTLPFLLVLQIKSFPFITSEIFVSITFLSKTVSFVLFSDLFLWFSSLIIIRCVGVGLSLWFSLSWILTFLFWNAIWIYIIIIYDYQIIWNYQWGCHLSPKVKPIFIL